MDEFIKFKLSKSTQLY